jgi:hypothetical protein
MIFRSDVDPFSAEIAIEWRILFKNVTGLIMPLMTKLRERWIEEDRTAKKIQQGVLEGLYRNTFEGLVVEGPMSVHTVRNSGD